MKSRTTPRSNHPRLLTYRHTDIRTYGQTLPPPTPAPSALRIRTLMPPISLRPNLPTESQIHTRCRIIPPSLEGRGVGGGGARNHPSRVLGARAFCAVVRP